MNKFVASAKRFLLTRKKPEEGVAVKGTGRKYTDWAKHKESNHSILWLIEHAVTLEMLQDTLKFANLQTNAQADTRRAWADAAERRHFILSRRPPTYEAVAFDEFMELAGKVMQLPTFQQLRQKELMLLAAAGAPVSDTNFLPITKDSPLRAPVSMDIQTAIDAAEVPRYVAPETIKAREDKGRLAVYSDGVRYSSEVSGTVTRMQIVGRRTKCPPFHPLNMPAVAIDRDECVYNEWDVKFFSGETDVTKAVVSETHPDVMRRSGHDLTAAVFSAVTGVAPMVWKQSIEERFGTKITVDQDAPVLPAKSDSFQGREAGALTRLKTTLTSFDKPPSLS